MASKVPARLAGVLMRAIKQGSIAVAGERIVRISVDNLEAPLKEFFQNLPEAAELISDGVVSMAEEAFNEVKKAGKSIGHKVEDVAEDIVDGVEHAGEVVLDAAKDAGEAIRDAFEDVEDFFGDLFKI
jgi:gas vesicle protein